MAQPKLSNRAVFLDRDGTINRDVGFTHRAEDLELLPHAAAGLARLAALGFQRIIVTNQSGIARGYFSEQQMHAFHLALRERLSQQGATIDAIYFCPFHATEGQGEYRRESPLRKPGDGMLRLAATERGIDLAASYAIGDKKSDVLAGQRAGCRTILLRTGAAGSDEEPLTAPPDFVADDLLAAADWIAASSAESTRNGS
ncbi:MAG: D-glycero-alpha-D-manno-heptose-1,7-bisphosphate 7-phosphatase [Pirellulales bacterium]